MKKMMITVIEVMILYDVNDNGNDNYNRYIVIVILLTIMLRKWHAVLTHWGRVTHICVGNLTIIGSDNGLSPGRRQAIIWTNAGILLIGPLRTNFSEIQIGIVSFSYKKMHLKMSSVKWRPFCLGLNVLTSEHIEWKSQVSESTTQSLLIFGLKNL